MTLVPNYYNLWRSDRLVELIDPIGYLSKDRFQIVEVAILLDRLAVDKVDIDEYCSIGSLQY